MSLLVKICGLGNRSDVEAAVAAGADAVGFVFAESPRRISPAAAKAAAQGLSSRVRTVAVMRHPSVAEWQEVLEVFRPDVLQTDAEDLDALEVPERVTRWPVFRDVTTQLHEDFPAVFLYEGAMSGKGQTVDWERAREVAQRGSMILAGGLDAGNVRAAVTKVRPYGVDVSSAVESAPGVKDGKKIKEFVQAARAAENDL